MINILTISTKLQSKQFAYFNMKANSWIFFYRFYKYMIHNILMIKIPKKTLLERLYISALKG